MPRGRKIAHRARAVKSHRVMVCAVVEAVAEARAADARSGAVFKGSSRIDSHPHADPRYHADGRISGRRPVPAALVPGSARAADRPAAGPGRRAGLEAWAEAGIPCIADSRGLRLTSPRSPLPQSLRDDSLQGMLAHR